MENKDTLILFDVGGVLLSLDFSRFYEAAAALSMDNITKEDFRRKYMDSGLEKKRLEGSITRTEFFKQLRTLINCRSNVTEKELEQAYRKIWVKALENIIKLKKRLCEKGYSVGIFSNASEIDREFIPELHPELFETYNTGPRIFSYSTKSLKPETPMYEQVKGYKKVIFIDDKESYLKTGIEKFGWNGILYTEFIDHSEAIRALHNDQTEPEKNFKKAKTEEELIKALAEFGVAV